MTAIDQPWRTRLRALLRSPFVDQGALSFGGQPARSLLHTIVVEEKKWLDEKRLCTRSLCTLLPGPEAQQPRPISVGQAARRAAG
jgi:chromate transport protein ChrA